jgi:hypothetical protein
MAVSQRHGRIVPWRVQSGLAARARNRVRVRHVSAPAISTASAGNAAYTAEAIVISSRVNQQRPWLPRKMGCSHERGGRGIWRADLAPRSQPFRPALGKSRREPFGELVHDRLFTQLDHQSRVPQGYVLVNMCHAAPSMPGPGGTPNPTTPAPRCIGLYFSPQFFFSPPRCPGGPASLAYSAVSMFGGFQRYVGTHRGRRTNRLGLGGRGLRQ